MCLSVNERIGLLTSKLVVNGNRTHLTYIHTQEQHAMLGSHWIPIRVRQTHFVLGTYKSSCVSRYRPTIADPIGSATLAVVKILPNQANHPVR